MNTRTREHSNIAPNGRSESIATAERGSKVGYEIEQSEPITDHWIRVFGPSSLSNLGPGFDTLGLCIGGIGDYVEARLQDAPGVVIESIEGDNGLLPRDPAMNTASVAAERVLQQLRSPYGIILRIKKHVPFGSGIGGSAASAVAGAWAASLLHGVALHKQELVDAVLDGEEVASGGRHGDNVLPALFGGLVLVSATDPKHYRRIPLVKEMPLAVITPDVQILTKQAREMLPREVALRDAIRNASDLAFLVDAFRCGDWETVGHCIMTDRLVEPVRATLVPCYQAVRQAAMDAGAFGCALTGSGPSMFAVTATPNIAERVTEAMLDASRGMGIPALGTPTEANADGVTSC
ncbi:MAG TPA: homoserine kinase [Rhodothermales bacterium]|nr:homoserine kinase [Rhodothermales bacterium]